MFDGMGESNVPVPSNLSETRRWATEEAHEPVSPTNQGKVQV
jgi:hypothetical protein